MFLSCPPRPPALVRLIAKINGWAKPCKDLHRRRPIRFFAVAF